MNNLCELELVDYGDAFIGGANLYEVVPDRIYNITLGDADEIRYIEFGHLLICHTKESKPFTACVSTLNRANGTLMVVKIKD